MKYNFDEVISRKNTNSVKWDFNEQLFDCEDVLPMWIADMDFKAPKEVAEAIIKRAEHGIYGYSDVTDSYRGAIVNWMQKRKNWEIKKEWICLSPGVVPALNIIVKTFTHIGDKVIIQSPVYHPFTCSIVNNGCQVVSSNLKLVNGKYEMDFEDFEKKIDSRVKMMILCNPHNPVGRVWTKEELTTLGEICMKHNIIVVSDEIHSDLIFKGNKHIPFASLSKEFEQNSITCTAPSKTFNIAGLQTSNIIIPNENLKSEYINGLENCGLNHVNLFGIVGCEAAYKYGEDWLEQVIEYIEENKKFVMKFVEERIPKIKVIDSEGTYLVWMDCRSLGMNSCELQEFMISKAKVAFSEGCIFGECGEAFERLNIACPRETLNEALIRIENAVNSL